MVAIDRRLGYIFIGFLALLSVAVLRAVDLGVFRAGSLRQAAVSQQITNETIPAMRGTITDANGVDLALSETAADIIVDPYLIKQPALAAQKLAPVLHMSLLTVLSAVSKPHTGYVRLARQVSSAVAHQAAALNINGISTSPDVKRVYPRNWFGAQVLGAVNSLGSGYSGLEWRYNSMLLGHDGQRRIVSDPHGQTIAIDNVHPMQTGKTLQLTLSAPLQSEVEQVLAGVGAAYSPQSATAIVMNPNTGAILALANWPRINANDPYVGASTATVNNAIQDHAVSFTYEPGSTFKAITVAGALQDGLITPNSQFDIPPQLSVFGSIIKDAEPHGYETKTTAGILRVSSNIGADLIGQKLGATRFNYWVHRFGFGAPTGVDLPGEDAGFILKPSNYSGTSMYNLPFGQGESVTPVQMIAAYAAIANGGWLRAPYVVQSVGGKAAPIPKAHQIISATTAAELRQMLKGVYADGGTASGAGIPGYDMAGKTGTANVAVKGGYSTSEYVASFVGMVPANHPQLLGMVVVDQPQGSFYGGSVAAPAFQKIVGWAVPYFGINPR
ncbi:MAG TPA: penicillin-binding protein 2 [Solirubrobacteraceae bacterium]|nr:penicillin-binding protein 2 [Solirubrobacteraceae bacterium]